MFVPYLAGIVLSSGVALFARSVGLDRDRAFYPTVLIVIASYYVLFAAMSESRQTMLLESIVLTGFAVAAVLGFKRSSRILVSALAVHGLFDVVHGELIDNPAVPAWWPAFCVTYDIGAAVGLACLAHERSSPVRARASFGRPPVALPRTPFLTRDRAAHFAALRFSNSRISRSTR
jgi:hypothetical protein